MYRKMDESLLHHVTNVQTFTKNWHTTRLLLGNVGRRGCMRNSNFGIGVLHVKRQILTSFICSLKLLLFHQIEDPVSMYLQAVPGYSVCPDTLREREPGRDREVLARTT